MKQFATSQVSEIVEEHIVLYIRTLHVCAFTNYDGEKLTDESSSHEILAGKILACVPVSSRCEVLILNLIQAHGVAAVC